MAQVLGGVRERTDIEAMHSVISHRKERHSCESRNLDVVPAKAGNQYLKIGFPRIKYGAGLVKPGMTSRAKPMSLCVLWGLPMGGHGGPLLLLAMTTFF